MEHLLAWAMIGVNAVLMVVNVVQYRRLLLARIVLQRLCVTAFKERMGPVWQAWCGSLGDISVDVHSAAYRFSYDPTTGATVRRPQRWEGGTDANH